MAVKSQQQLLPTFMEQNTPGDWASMMRKPRFTGRAMNEICSVHLPLCIPLSSLRSFL